MGQITQLLRLTWIGDKPGLDQNGGMSGDFNTTKTGFLRAVYADDSPAPMSEGCDYNVHTRIHARCHRQIQQYTGQYLILVVKIHTAHPPMRSELFSRSASHFAVSLVAPFFDSAYTRGAFGVRIIEGVGVYRNQQVSIVVTRNIRSLAQRGIKQSPERVRFALNPPLALIWLVSVTGDIQHHILRMPSGPSAPGSCPVSGIHHDDNIPWRPGFNAGDFNRLLDDLTLLLKGINR